VHGEGPGADTKPSWEVGVVSDEEGTAVIHATRARALVDRMSKSRARRVKALEEWAERVESSDLKEADTEALRTIAELTEQRDEVEQELTEAVRSARQAHRSWSEIGMMLGVSKQAARRKYGSKVTA
jgi:hypothetical protein